MGRRTRQASSGLRLGGLCSLDPPGVTTGQASGFAQPLPPGAHLPQRPGTAGDLVLSLKTDPSPHSLPRLQAHVMCREDSAARGGVLCARHAAPPNTTARSTRTLQPAGPCARPRASPHSPGDAGPGGAAPDLRGRQAAPGECPGEPGAPAHLTGTGRWHEDRRKHWPRQTATLTPKPRPGPEFRPEAETLTQPIHQTNSYTASATRRVTALTPARPGLGGGRRSPRPPAAALGSLRPGAGSPAGW